MIKEYLKPLKTTVYVYVMIICTTLYLRAFQEKKKRKIRESRNICFFKLKLNGKILYPKKSVKDLNVKDDENLH